MSLKSFKSPGFMPDHRLSVGDAHAAWFGDDKAAAVMGRTEWDANT